MLNESNDLKNKYRLESEDIGQIKTFLRRAFKVLVAILFIKLLRRYLLINEDTRNLMHTVLVTGDLGQSPEQLIVLLASSVITICLAIWGGGFVLLGKRILTMKVFNVLMIVGIADALMMLVFRKLRLPS